MYRFLFAALVYLISTLVNASTLPLLTQEPVHKRAIKEITAAIKFGHYQPKALNDNLSGQVLAQYIKTIDPSRSYFYKSDIDEFNKQRLNLDNEIKRGELNTAYQVFNRLQQRTRERLDFSIKELKTGKPFNFSLDETLNTDREDSPWIQTRQEMDRFWRKRLKGAMLNLKLADKTEQEARDILIKRYSNQLKMLTQTKSEDVFQAFTNAYTQLYDPHSQYFSPQKTESFNINMRLSLEGIGAVLTTENEYTKVVRLVPAGPAAKSGKLKATDLIVGIGQGEKGDIEDVVGRRLEDVVDLIRGPKGTVVRLQVKTAGREDVPLKIIKIVRNKVKLEEQAAHKQILEVEHLGKKFRIGVIVIPTFYIDFAAMQRGDDNYKSTSRDVEKLIAELNKENIDGLIIDLRNNGGGSLREANDTVGLFIKHGPTVQIKNAMGRIDVLRDTDKKIAYKGPLVVLVNRLSASASEIFAGAIQDYRRGLVIGGQTFGKGTVQTLLPLNHGQLKLTHAKFYRISGESTQNKGVIPDISFPTIYDPEFIGENVLEQALSWDKVPSIPHKIYSTQPFLDDVKRRYQARSKADPDFIFVNEQIQHMEEAKKQSDIILLQEKDLKEKRDTAEQWQIDAENRRREKKHQAIIEKLTDLTEGQEKDAQGNPISPESKAMLMESARILLDFSNLRTGYSTAKHSGIKINGW